MTQREFRKMFWERHPELSRKRIKNYSGTGTMYCTDTRVAFVDFVDSMRRDGAISADFASMVTLK